MNPFSRKLTFQLTPLLDLLLIVIFAQYMEVRETSATEQTKLKTAQQQSISAQHEADELRALQALAVEEARDIKTLLNKQTAEVDRLQKRLEKREHELSEKIRAALLRQEQVGDIVSELFQVPEKLMKEVLDADASGQVRSPEEIEKLKKAFQKLASNRGYDVIKHLLTYEELRKRSDVWELYVSESGTFVFTTGTETYRFRAKSADVFSTELFEKYKTLPQPKGLVIILLSRGDATSGDWQTAIDGLRKAASQMRADSNGRTRFEYANLGLMPEKFFQRPR